MNRINKVSPDEIRNAVKEVKKIKPEYTLMFDLYEQIFIAQETSKNDIHLHEFAIPDEVLSLKLKEKFPLSDISQFTVDTEASEKLFKEICGILVKTGNELSESVNALIELTDNNKINLKSIFTAFLKEDESLFNKIESDFHLDKKILAFIIYNSIKPSLTMFSQALSQYLDKENTWDKGYCPVCGSMPELSVFKENGKRFLICGFCSHEWESKRIYCPFCDNTDHKTINYYDIENEEEYRVDTCDRCGKYIKTIDINKTTRSIYLPLEYQSTPYIDLKFEEIGFKAGNLKTG